jgi:taurine dioxygenase
MRLEARPLSHALGAEIIGVDFSKPLDEATIAEIRHFYLEYCVLLFRGQKMTREEQIAFSRCFGELDDNHRNPLDRDPDHPEILLIPSPNAPKAGARPAYAASVWHSDGTIFPNPAAASIYRAIDLPPVGGDTMFSNLYLAYETLSAGMQKLIDNLFGIYLSTVQIVDVENPAAVAELRRRSPPMAHPVVRTHPQTGRKSLFLQKKVNQFIGMTVEESRPIAEFLLNHAGRPQFVYRHQWQTDDLLIWDNRCTNHMAVNDFDRSQPRIFERATVIGEPSGGYVIPESQEIEFVYDEGLMLDHQARRRGAG